MEPDFYPMLFVPSVKGQKRKPHLSLGKKRGSLISVKHDSASEKSGLASLEAIGIRPEKNNAFCFGVYGFVYTSPELLSTPLVLISSSIDVRFPNSTDL